jgi:hypothetical protein
MFCLSDSTFGLDGLDGLIDEHAKRAAPLLFGMLFLVEF